MKTRFALNFGTSRTRIWTQESGVVVDEPTVVAISTNNQEIISIGEDANLMLGRTPENLLSVKPVIGGAIADLEVSRGYLTLLFSRVLPRFHLRKPEAMIAIGSGYTQVERRALLDVVGQAGVSRAYLVDEPLTAAIGSGIPVSAPAGYLVVTIGAGKSEAAVISLGSVVVSGSVRVGGNAIDEAIQSYIRTKHSMLVGPQTAESLKKSLGHVLSPKETKSHSIHGRDVVFGLPKAVDLSDLELAEIMIPVLRSIANMIRSVLEQTPPELASDIIDKGIVLTGGGSLLSGIDKFFTEELGVPCSVTEDPELSVVRGAGIVLENLELWKRSVFTKV